jgi:competence protein ComEC
MLLGVVMASIALLRGRFWLSGALIGLVWMSCVANWYVKWQFPLVQIQQAEQVQGRVLDVIPPQDNADRIRFNFRIEVINGERIFSQPKVRLSWFKPPFSVRQGDSLNLNVKLKAPHGLANEGGFLYQQWLLSQSIVATGYIKKAQATTLLEKGNSYRQRLSEQILSQPLEHKAWIAALALGYRSLLSAEDWQILQRTGVAHLVAISGLHLGMVAGVSYLILTWIFSFILANFPRIGNLIGTFNAHRLALVATLLPTLFYAAIAGFALPTVRAWIMLLIATVLIYAQKTWQWRYLLMYSLAVFLVIFPTSIFSLSFWMSFGAIGIITFVFWRWPIKTSANEGVGRHVQLWSVTIRLQLCLSLLMLPLVAWQFSILSMIAPFVNLIAIPYVTFVLLPLCLLTVLLLMMNSHLAIYVLSWIDWLMSLGIDFLAWTLDIPGACWMLPDSPMLVWGCIAIVAFVVLLPPLPIKKYWFVLLCMPLLSYFLPRHEEDWQVTALDVGQGLSIVIHKQNRVIVYDTGAAYPSGFNMADAVIIPYLQAKGIKEIDRLYLSHGDNDHSGAAPMLLESIPVTEVIRDTRCREGDHFQWQNLRIEMLWPTERQSSSNDSSCVIRIRDDEFSVLLPGDISKSVERRLVERFAENLQSSVLIAPHHGSNTSSSEIFIKAVQPEWVVFSQGKDNRWGFPVPEVVARYRSERVKLLKTSQSGQINIHFRKGKGIKVMRFREDMQSFWYRKGTKQSSHPRG